MSAMTAVNPMVTDPVTASNGRRHYVIIGSGVAGNHAADLLRSRDADSRITLLTVSRLLCVNRYDLPQVFAGRTDWRAFLSRPPAHYRGLDITVRRDSRVIQVDAPNHRLTLAHKEVIHYDRLLVATGGRGHLPAGLAAYRPLMQGFGSWEQAMQLRATLPEGGTAVMLGGDMIGLDLARTLIGAGYHVRVVADEHTFWPHDIPADQRASFLAAVARLGIDVIEGSAVEGVTAIEAGAAGLPARRVVFGNGESIYGDAVLPFFGLVPTLEFMQGADGPDIERGLLVAPSLRSTDADIYAAGDVCQIWSAAERRYRFYYGARNVRAMGAVAARNMTGGEEEFVSSVDETLHIDENGQLASEFWVFQ